MGRARKELLARAGLAGYQDRQGRARGLLEIAEERQHPGMAGDDAERCAPALQARLLGVLEWRLGELTSGPRSRTALQLLEPGARLLFLDPGGSELDPQRLLAARRSSHGGARVFQVFLERLDDRLLAHETLADRGH